MSGHQFFNLLAGQQMDGHVDIRLRLKLRGLLGQRLQDVLLGHFEWYRPLRDLASVRVFALQQLPGSGLGSSVDIHPPRGLHVLCGQDTPTPPCHCWRFSACAVTGPVGEGGDAGDDAGGAGGPPGQPVVWVGRRVLQRLLLLAEMAHEGHERPRHLVHLLHRDQIRQRHLHLVRRLGLHIGVAQGQVLHHEVQLVQAGDAVPLAGQLLAVPQQRFPVPLHLAARQPELPQPPQLLHRHLHRPLPVAGLRHDGQRADGAPLPGRVAVVHLDAGKGRVGLLVPRAYPEVQHAQHDARHHLLHHVTHAGDLLHGQLAEDRQHVLLQQAVPEHRHHRLLARLQRTRPPPVLHVGQLLETLLVWALSGQQRLSRVPAGVLRELRRRGAIASLAIAGTAIGVGYGRGEQLLLPLLVALLAGGQHAAGGDLAEAFVDLSLQGIHGLVEVAHQVQRRVGREVPALPELPQVVDVPLLDLVGAADGEALPEQVLRVQVRQ
mmetsp:Transcript_8109/g.24095  ORF Transcript_8109/g.24095 Transcript_8109/m.24095 type:complete len:492 (+) Transcript_8109:1909-3384(+)